MMEEYNEEYFERGVERGISNYHGYSWEVWESYTTFTAKHIVERFRPGRTLDVGCAKGFLVYALFHLGVDAWGVDASPYATARAMASVRERVLLGCAQELPFAAEKFDLVTAFDVLEHIPEAEISRTCGELLRVSRQWVVVRVPTRKEEGDLDVYHCTIKPQQWWQERFVEAGGRVEPVAAYANPMVGWFNVPDYLLVVRKSRQIRYERKTESVRSGRGR